MCLVNCASDEFRCHDGQCLSIDKRCNGKVECSAHEDEDNCQLPFDENYTGTIHMSHI